MNTGRCFTCTILSGLFLVAGLSPLLAAENDWETPRTEHGYPDLQGNWTNPFQTPLERPLSLDGKQTYTEEEVIAFAKKASEIDALRQAPIDPNRPAPEIGSRIGQQADGNFSLMLTELAKINGEYPTAYITDPPNGQLPYIPNPQERDIFGLRSAQGHRRFDGPENLPATSRCLSGATALPLLRAFFDADIEAGGSPGGDDPIRNIQIVQNKDYVVILLEYLSLVRIIRLNDEHMLDQGAKWMGDSVAYYEGDSLIIHSTDFRPEQSTAFLRTSAQLQVEERYTRIGNNEIVFAFTVTDPEIFTQTFSATMLLTRLPPDLKLYEYSCHEGNYSMPSMLRGARMEEMDYFQ